MDKDYKKLLDDFGASLVEYYRLLNLRNSGDNTVALAEKDQFMKQADLSNQLHQMASKLSKVSTS